MNEHPSISVIMPVFRADERFALAIAGILAADPVPMETIIVADGNTASVRRVCRESDITVLDQEPQGPAVARNKGALHARGDILFFVDSDVVIPRDTFALIGRIMSKDASVGALFGSYDDTPADPSFISQYRNLFHHYIHQTADSEASTFWSGCGAVRRSLFQAVGGFDASYRYPCVEDIEFGYRLVDRNVHILLCKNLQVTHLKPWRFRSLLKTDFVHRALPWTDLILRRRRVGSRLNLRWDAVLSGVVVCLLFGSLFGSILFPGILVVSSVTALGLLFLNAPLYRYFFRKRGIRFAVSSIPLHWLYYLSGSIAFGVGALRFLIQWIERRIR